MIRARFIEAIVVGLLFVSHQAHASCSIPISPGGGKEEVSVETGCPLFSWSSVDGAAGYRLEVFSLAEETLDHQAASERGRLALRVDIPAPALSWSPSNEEALQPGQSYVWFIKALDELGGGRWSSGSRFRVDFAAFLSGIDEAVRQKVREYVKTDPELREIIKDIRSESDQKESPALSAAADEGPEGRSLQGTEGPTNTFYGLDAGKVTSGGYNTFIGRSAGFANTNGLSNVFIGYQAGVANVGGSSNIAIGYQAGEANGYGMGNTVIGWKAGEANTVSDNTMIGYEAGNHNSTGQQNVFVGSMAGRTNTTGNSSTLIGYMAGEASTGSSNTMVGSQAGKANTTGQGNVFLGAMSGNKNTGGYYNTFLGTATGDKNTTGNFNTFVGSTSGVSNTTANFNVFLGESTGYYNTTGSGNVFVGSSAGYSNTEGTGNTFSGTNAGHKSTTSSYNTFIGYEAGYYNTTGSSNTFLGRTAGHKNQGGSFNTFAGDDAGHDNTEGTANTFLGGSSGYKNTTGSYNTYVGKWAGYFNLSGQRNVFIGFRAGQNETGSNKLYIHNSELSDPLIYGEFDTRMVKINGGLQLAEVASSSDLDLKKNIRPIDDPLEKITSLRGVSFEWRAEEFPDRGFKEGRHIGLVAQEVERVLPEIVRTDRDGKKSLAYDKLTAVLVEAIKKQQEQIAESLSRLSSQEAQLNAQAAQIEELKEMVKRLAPGSSGYASKEISLVFEHN